MVCRWGRVDQFWHFNEKASQVKILADKIPNFSEVSEDICWQDPKFQLEYPVLKTLWPRPSLSIDIVTSIFMLILRRSTPNLSHHMVVHGSSRLSDNTLLLWDQVVGDRLCWFLPTKSTQKLRNTLVSVYYELIISSHCDELWEPECTIDKKLVDRIISRSLATENVPGRGESSVHLCLQLRLPLRRRWSWWTGCCCPPAREKPWTITVCLLGPAQWCPTEGDSAIWISLPQIAQPNVWQ